MASPGKIIKADALSRTVKAAPSRVVRRDVEKARQWAGEIMEAARGHAAQISAQAEQQRVTTLQAAAQQGYEEGLRRWNEILAESVNRSEEIVRRHEADLVRLAARMAEKIIGERLNADPATLISIVGEALKSVRRERSLTIQVHPDSVELIRANLDELKARVGGSKEIWVEANLAVEAGGCIVVSDVGVIDARIDTQLRCMEKALLGAANK
jgi:type III secretion protein L